MGNMCKYFYGEGRCSNPNVDGVLCGGRQVCDFFSKSNDREEQACDHDAWYGLYCAKYKRFFCPGKENGTGENHQVFRRQTLARATSGAAEPEWAEPPYDEDEAPSF